MFVDISLLYQPDQLQHVLLGQHLSSVDEHNVQTFIMLSVVLEVCRLTVSLMQFGYLCGLLLINKLLHPHYSGLLDLSAGVVVVIFYAFLREL